jgi:magnesium chelatase family protein
MAGSYAQIFAYGVFGIDAYRVSVEIDISATPNDQAAIFQIVGLPEGAVRESRDRVRAAIGNSGFWFPGGRVTANLAPADIRKEGVGFDLPLAIGLLVASRSLQSERLGDYAIVGELGLNGEVRGIRGALPLALGVRADRMKGLILPAANAREAAVVEEIEVIPVESIAEAVGFLNGETPIEPVRVNAKEMFETAARYDLDLADVRGQTGAKRALEVAAAGGHNLLMIGSPGSGKTMLARRLPSILPVMIFEESIEVTKIHSIAGLVGSEGIVATRPFRTPHHTMSNVALAGGGAVPKPGQVSLAHHGILFLDEMPEFPRTVLETLRQPLEDGVITITRAAMSSEFPARFMLCGSMNPCPCGYMTDPGRECRCSPIEIQRYQSRLSGPLLDRIDIHIEVPPVKYQELTRGQDGEPSASVRDRVQRARDRQLARFEGIGGVLCNAHMRGKEIRKFCALDEATLALLERAMAGLGLSARAYDRILKVARTIADLEGKETIDSTAVSEAINYRTLDREMWKRL